MNANKSIVEMVMNAISFGLVNQFNAYGATTPFVAVISNVDAAMNFEFVRGGENFFLNGQHGLIQLREFCQDTLSDRDGSVIGVLLAREGWIHQLRADQQPVQERSVVIIFAMNDGNNYSRILPIDAETRQIKYQPCGFESHLNQSIVGQFTGGELRNDASAVPLNAEDALQDGFRLSDVHPEPPGLH